MSTDPIRETLDRYPDSESVMATGDNYLIACWFRGEAARLARALHIREERDRDNVTKFHPVVVGEGYRFDADAILDGAKGQEFTNVVIVGEMPDGDLWVSSAANSGEAMILMERAKHKIVFPE